MPWRASLLASLTCGAAILGGCSTPSKPELQLDLGAGMPIATAAAVPVSSVVNQLKCDVGAFLKAQDHPSPYFTVYNVTGTLTFSLDRASNGSWSVAVAPSLPAAVFAPGLSASFSRAHANGVDTNDDLVLKFDMATQPDPRDDPHAPTALAGGACEKGLGPSARLIDPLALQAQIDAIVLGAPKIGFETVEYHGKFVLTRSDDDKKTLSLYIISAGFPSTARTSAYTQQFDITLQLQPPPAAKSTFVGGAAPPLYIPPLMALPHEGTPRKQHVQIAGASGGATPPTPPSTPPAAAPQPNGLSPHLQNLLAATGSPPN